MANVSAVHSIEPLKSAFQIQWQCEEMKAVQHHLLFLTPNRTAWLTSQNIEIVPCRNKEGDIA